MRKSEKIVISVALGAMVLLFCSGAWLIWTGHKISQEKAAERAKIRNSPEYIEKERLDRLEAWCKVFARGAVKLHLKAPETATFSDQRYRRVETGAMRVTGKVTAQNAFGAKLTQTYDAYIVETAMPPGTLAGLEIDGESVYVDPKMAVEYHQRVSSAQ